MSNSHDIDTQDCFEFSVSQPLIQVLEPPIHSLHAHHPFQTSLASIRTKNSPE